MDGPSSADLQLDQALAQANIEHAILRLRTLPATVSSKSKTTNTEDNRWRDYELYLDEYFANQPSGPLSPLLPTPSESESPTPNSRERSTLNAHRVRESRKRHRQTTASTHERSKNKCAGICSLGERNQSTKEINQHARRTGKAQSKAIRRGRRLQSSNLHQMITRANQSARKDDWQLDVSGKCAARRGLR